jgi:DNA-binding MarR family transcriptional regulator
MLEQAMPRQYYDPETLEPQRSVGFLIKRCGVLMNQFAERGFESQPISFTQWVALMTLTQRPHVSPTELSEHMGHDMGALTRLVDELQRDGLVRRERSEHDRRAVEIAITPEGRRVANGGKRVVVDLLNRLVEPYSVQEIEGLIVLLQRLLTQMQSIANTELLTPPQEGTPARAASAPQRANAKVTRAPRAARKRKIAPVRIP